MRVCVRACCHAHRWRQLVFDSDGKQFSDARLRRLNVDFPSLRYITLDLDKPWPGRWALRVSE